MADVANPEVKDIPGNKESAPKKRGRPPAKKPVSVTVKFKNMSNVDLPIPGDMLKSGETKSYPAHIGQAIEQSEMMQNYIRMKQVEVS